MKTRLWALGLGAFVLSACTSLPVPGGDTVVGSKSPKAAALPMRWDDRPEAAEWTDATMNALAGPGAALPLSTPRDIDAWCPAYREAETAQRQAFWAGLLSTLAKHESTWNPRAVGGGGRWFGLVQISPGTARGYGCAARTGEALKDGSANLSCAVRILATTVPRDQVVSRGMRGAAADWGPFHSARKREDMRAWTREQSYCRAG